MIEEFEGVLDSLIVTCERLPPKEDLCGYRYIGQLCLYAYQGFMGKSLIVMLVWTRLDHRDGVSATPQPSFMGSVLIFYQLEAAWNHWFIET